MSRPAAFLALLLCLYWTRAQGESGGLTENDVSQTNITPDIWAELKELRNILRKLEQENSAIQARLTASENKNTVLETRMNASDNKVEELERENTDLKARLNSGEKVVEELKRENTVLEARMNSNELQVEEGKRQIAEQPKVAFSGSLGNVGRLGPFGTETTLKFNNIYTNIGEAYSPTTGDFTAPVRGIYYFTFKAWESHDRNHVGVILYHNNKEITYTYDRAPSLGYANAFNTFVLQLEKGDMVYLALWSNDSVYDDTDNHSTFSGFLLYAL